MTTPLDRLLQAIENVANSFGGNTGRVLLAIIREYKRLERWEQDQAMREERRKQKEAEKEFKVTGKWPDDDIPF